VLLKALLVWAYVILVQITQHSKMMSYTCQEKWQNQLRPTPQKTAKQA
jgi:hypothetical protein